MGASIIGSIIIFGLVSFLGFEIFIRSYYASFSLDIFVSSLSLKNFEYIFGSCFVYLSFSFIGSLAPFLLSFLLDFFFLSLRMSSFFCFSNSWTFYGMVGLITYNSESPFLSGI
jgi:hypothetical protein